MSTVFYSGQQDYISQLNNLWDRVTQQVASTSTSSNSISTGNKTFVIEAGKQFAAGMQILVTNTADATKYMYGSIESYSGTSLVINSTAVGGSGTYASWNITMTGPIGLQGPSGATGAQGPAGTMSSFTGGLSTADYADFNTSASDTIQVGRLRWNDVDGTLDLGLKGGVVVLQLGQEQLIRVLNKTGSTIPNGTCVYISGAQGNRVTVAVSDYSSESSSSRTVGLTTESIANNQEGFCTISGLVRDFDTSAFTEGSTVYLGASGALTSTKPVAPLHMCIMGYVARSHATNGVIFVNIQNGFELDELHDVAISSPSIGQFLQYDGSKWINSTLRSDRAVYISSNNPMTAVLPYCMQPVTWFADGTAVISAGANYGLVLTILPTISTGYTDGNYTGLTITPTNIVGSGSGLVITSILVENGVITSIGFTQSSAINYKSGDVVSTGTGSWGADIKLKILLNTNASSYRSTHAHGLYISGSENTTKPVSSINNCTFINVGDISTIGVNNQGTVAIGRNTLSMSLGQNNTGVGTGSLIQVSGSANTAIGGNSLPKLLSGVANTAIGANAAYDLLSGSNNTILGSNTNIKSNASSTNTIIGSVSVITYGSGSIILGYNSVSNNSNALIVGNNIVGSSNAGYINIGGVITRNSDITGTSLVIENPVGRTVVNNFQSGAYYETVATASSSTTYGVSLTDGTIHDVLLTANVTYTFPDPTVNAGASFTLFQTQDSTGSRTVTWPSSVRWPESTAPTITTTANKTDEYIFTAVRGFWVGRQAGKNYTLA